MFISVDLPAPFSPTSPRMDPRLLTVRLTSFRTRTPEKLLSIRASVNAGASIGFALRDRPPPCGRAVLGFLRGLQGAEQSDARNPEPHPGIDDVPLASEQVQAVVESYDEGGTRWRAG